MLDTIDIARFTLICINGSVGIILLQTQHAFFCEAIASPFPIHAFMLKPNLFAVLFYGVA
jgi:hypothetical protein